MYNSKNLSKEFNISHYSISKIIYKYKEDFEMFGDIKIITKKKGIKGGRPERFFNLNEKQKLLLIIYLNTNKLRKYKINIIKNMI